MINAKDFIKTYEKYYFKEEYEMNARLGIKGIKPTSNDVEKWITKEKLENGIHDEYVIAWKIGGLRTGEQIVDPKNVPGNYGNFDISSYLVESNERRTDILGYTENALKFLKTGNSFFDAIDDLIKAFNLLKECKIPKKFGSVYIVNSMFFLTKGDIPVYDRNAYRAIQALYLNKNPKDITVSDAPSSADSLGAMFRLLEYMWLLDKVFGKEKSVKSESFPECEHGGYISRGIDRALWVYGQCTKKYESEEP